MVFAYLLLVLVPVSALIYILWNHRRNRAERDAASAGRLQEILIVAAHQGAASEQSVDGLVVARRTTDSRAPAASPYALRERLLTTPQTLLYYLLKTGLPDHIVLAQVSLASLLEDAADSAQLDGDGQHRKALIGHTLDFVVCDKTMKPQAVIELSSEARMNGIEHTRLAATWLLAAGVRYLELDGAALPRKEAVRALVLGSQPPRKSAETGAEPHAKVD